MLGEILPNIMTLISALISIKGTAVSTDSLITVRDEQDKTSVEQVEWNLPKLVRLEKFKGIISFWGGAVAEVKYTSSANITKQELGWTLYNWLNEKCKNIEELDLEDFVKRLTNDLKVEYSKRKWSNYGIGLHITGYEYIDNTFIPELFLVSNYADTSYITLRELSYSRETYHTISNTPPADNHRELEYRKAVHSYLLTGEIIIYNNGDPTLFNPVFKAIWQSYLDSKAKNRVREISTLNNLISLVRRPIEFVSKFQSDFFKHDKILIGGQIHDLAVWRDGNYISTSGD